MSKKKNELERYISSDSSGVLLKNGRIKIKGDIIQKLNRATDNLIEEILSSVST